MQECVTFHISSLISPLHSCGTKSFMLKDFCITFFDLIWNFALDGSFFHIICHCEMKGKSSMLLSPEFKNMLFYVVFNAELNCTIRILCFCRAIIDLLWPSWAHWDYWLQKVHIFYLRGYCFLRCQGSFFWPWMILILI